MERSLRVEFCRGGLKKKGQKGLLQIEKMSTTMVDLQEN